MDNLIKTLLVISIIALIAGLKFGYDFGYKQAIYDAKPISENLIEWSGEIHGYN